MVGVGVSVDVAVWVGADVSAFVIDTAYSPAGIAVPFTVIPSGSAITPLQAEADAINRIIVMHIVTCLILWCLIFFLPRLWIFSLFHYCG
jgi:hypothetical protein